MFQHAYFQLRARADLRKDSHARCGVVILRISDKRNAVRLCIIFRRRAAHAEHRFQTEIPAKSIFADIGHAVRNGHFADMLTVRKSLRTDGNNSLRQIHKRYRPALIKCPVAYRFKPARKRKRFKRTVVKRFFAYLRNVVRNVHIRQPVAQIKSVSAYLCQVRRQRNVFERFAPRKHTVRKFREFCCGQIGAFKVCAVAEHISPERFQPLRKRYRGQRGAV